ncbi:MAG: hypothetical protein DYG94_02535 [Leptolyngbya sp. PLA3]|nr:MAG: hypothetical protein EDM82_02020 [Cyanobacteria bacterium CYA]MCE7967606.1 hypothetical protein [Leptolyngbya sp. PL-A3]
MLIRLATEAMATRFELVLHGEDEFFLRAAAEEAIQLIHEQHNRLSAFSTSSLVWRLNALAAQRPIEVDRELWDLLTLCEQVWTLSNGAFDPAIGSLMKRWGFRGDPPPAGDGVRPSGFAHVELDASRHTVRFHHPDVSIDLGAVAKGFALDLAARHVRSLGVKVGLLHGGTSTAVALGAPPPDAPTCRVGGDDAPCINSTGRDSGWLIRIPAPSDPSLTARLADRALSVSSPAGRTVADESGTHGHIMDPRAGVPASLGGVAAVAGSSAAETDAWSTALIVLGARPASMPAGLDSAHRAPGRQWVIQPAQAGPGSGVFHL